MKKVLFVILRSAALLLVLVTQTVFGQGPSAPAEIPSASEQGPPSDNPQGAPPPWAIPQFRLLREEEDFSYLAKPELRGHDLFDPLKYIQLRSRDNWYLTIGADAREWFEWYRNENFGEFSYFPP